MTRRLTVLLTLTASLAHAQTSQPVTVNAIPPMAITLTASATTVRSGSPLTLTAVVTFPEGTPAVEFLSSVASAAGAPDVDTVIGTDDVSPYTLTIPAVASGITVPTQLRYKARIKGTGTVSLPVDVPGTPPSSGPTFVVDGWRYPDQTGTGAWAADCHPEVGPLPEVCRLSATGDCCGVLHRDGSQPVRVE